MEGAHDLGGWDGFGAVVTDDGEATHHAPWELRAQALAILGLGSARPWIERLEPADYLAASYYERWLLAAELGLVGRGVIEPDELDRWRATFEADDEALPPVVTDASQRARIDHMMTHNDRMPMAVAPRFSIGDAVIVRRMRDKMHNRCPRYVRGAPGRIERVCGNVRIPGRGPDAVGPMYTVEFSSTQLWGTGDEPAFSVLVDLCEHYLDAGR